MWMNRNIPEEGISKDLEAIKSTELESAASQCSLLPYYGKQQTNFKKIRFSSLVTKHKQL